MRAIYDESESFKTGWVAGFYDARPDDGLHYLDDVLRYGVRTADEQALMNGYKAGRTARLGGEAAIWPSPPPMAVRPDRAA